MESDSEEISEEIGEQAAKIVMNMADREPGTQRVVAVPVDFVIQIAFWLYNYAWTGAYLDASG